MLFYLGFSMIAIVTLAWNVRKLKDGFHIKQELKYVSLSTLFPILMVVVDATVQGGKLPLLPGALWLTVTHTVATVSIYPVAKSYGWNFQPFYPWTWFGCVSLWWAHKRRARCEEVQVNLADILTLDEYKVSDINHARHAGLFLISWCR